MKALSCTLYVCLNTMSWLMPVKFLYWLSSYYQCRHQLENQGELLESLELDLNYQREE